MARSFVGTLSPDPRTLTLTLGLTLTLTLTPTPTLTLTPTPTPTPTLIHVGTAAYMAPERITGCEYSFGADVWAVGVVAVECAQVSSPSPSPFILTLTQPYS